MQGGAGGRGCAIIMQLARPPTGRTTLFGCVFHLESRALNLDKCFFSSKMAFKCKHAEMQK